MKRHLISTILFVVYSAMLIDVMVFKHLPTIRIGQLRFKYGGTRPGPPNLIPFRTILPYLMGERGIMNAVLNLVGNIVLLVPIGFLAAFARSNMTWKKSFLVALTAGLAIEGLQLLFRVGIFDVDDLILNGLGVMIGYWVVTKKMKGKLFTEKSPGLAG